MRRKIRKEELKKAVEEQPDSYLRELAEARSESHGRISAFQRKAKPGLKPVFRRTHLKRGAFSALFGSFGRNTKSLPLQRGMSR